jgi:DNA-binding Lrp family transcriptional regulator
MEKLIIIKKISFYLNPKRMLKKMPLLNLCLLILKLNFK